jgi:nucleotide-binding universal stress UspA family protein
MLQEVRRRAGSHEAFRKILVSNDGSEQAFRALSAAFGVALSHHATLHMIVIDEVPRFSDSVAEIKGEIEMAHERFAPMVSKSKDLAAGWGLTLHCHIVLGHAASTVVEFAHVHSFDLIVIGLAPYSLLYQRFIGSTADRVVKQATCAVLVVK